MQASKETNGENGRKDDIIIRQYVILFQPHHLSVLNNSPSGLKLLKSRPVNARMAFKAKARM